MTAATTVALTFPLHYGNFYSLITILGTLANTFHTLFLSHLSRSLRLIRRTLFLPCVSLASHLPDHSFIHLSDYRISFNPRQVPFFFSFYLIIVTR